MRMVATEKRAQIHLCGVNQCRETTHKFSYEDTVTDHSPPFGTTRLNYGILLHSCKIACVITFADGISGGS